MKKILSLLLLVFLAWSCRKEKQAYVFTYFDNSRQDAGLFVAYSYDGYHWTAVNDGEPIMKPLVGKDGIMRVPQTGELLMALKNENLNPPEKNIRLTRSRAMAEGFPTEVSAPISGEEWAEGPTLIPIGDDILVYVDQFRKHRYGAALSHDGGYTWEDATDRISVPAEMNHGTAIVVPERYVKALAGHNFETE